MTTAFKNKEIKTRFEQMWKTIVSDQYKYKGRKYDLDAILKEYNSNKLRNRFMTFIMISVSQPDVLKRGIIETLERHQIQVDDYTCPFCLKALKKVKNEYKHIKSCPMYEKAKEIY
jgi:hypothetical protein